MTSEVWFTGVGASPFGRFLDGTLREFTETAVEAALKDAALAPSDIDAVIFANVVAGLTTGQESIRGQVALRHLGLLGTPIFNTENACASGSAAVRLATFGIRAGEWRRVLVVGAEKMTHPDRSVTYRALGSAAEVTDPDSPPDGSLFMRFYAEHAREVMARTGATDEDLAQIVVKNRRHAAANPIAQNRTPVTVEEVLGSGEVATPLTRFMCSPISDGAAAVVLEATPRRDAGRPDVCLAGAELVSGTEDGLSPVARAVAAAYRAAGITGIDVDVVELHDAAAPAELEYYSVLGLCSEGDSAEFLRSGASAVGGGTPVNPGGGLVARGHPLGATGVAQLVELVTQLRGEAGDRQVHGARVAVAQNAGGDLGGVAAASAAHVLRRED